MNTITEQRNERTAQLLWTGLILMFFVLQAVLWTVAISMTAGDSSHAVVSGYDEQALKWDEVQQQRHASDALGWDSEIHVDPVSDVRGNRIVTVSIRDQSEQPIERADVSIKVFHRAHAAHAQQLALKAVGPGIYSGSLNVQNSGQWRFSGLAETNDGQYLFEQQMEIDSNRNL